MYMLCFNVRELYRRVIESNIHVHMRFQEYDTWNMILIENITMDHEADLANFVSTNWNEVIHEAIIDITAYYRYCYMNDLDDDFHEMNLHKTS